MEDKDEGVISAVANLDEVVEGGSVLGDMEEERLRQGEALKMESVDQRQEDDEEEGAGGDLTGRGSHEQK